MILGRGSVVLAGATGLVAHMPMRISGSAP